MEVGRGEGRRSKGLPAAALHTSKAAAIAATAAVAASAQASIPRVQDPWEPSLVPLLLPPTPLPQDMLLGPGLCLLW